MISCDAPSGVPNDIRTIEEPQYDLDVWIEGYNRERTHHGKRCQGRTPYETFVDGKTIVREKLIAA